ncbi:MAG TPA: hypothetical protein VKU19_03070 [Bryobacteraceae bacterium]|nr:hypothetical protein [Bryobacteraceae bacterium]
MLFESTTILLRSIVHSLEGSSETGWDDRLEAGNQCLYELHQLARSSARNYKADSKAKFPAVAPAFERAIRAIPHVKSMMRSIRGKDHGAAIESGKAAIGEMEGIKAVLPSVPSIEPALHSNQPANLPAEPEKKVHRHKQPAKPKRVAVAKRKPARASAAASR